MFLEEKKQGVFSEPGTCSTLLSFAAEERSELTK
jgi:hypothetical protein